MKIMDKLERRMGRFYIENLMQYILFGMAGIFLLDLMPFSFSASTLLYFNRALILKGEVWRILTFVFLPIGGDILSMVLAGYLLYIFGTALENRWGSRRFTLYYLLGVLCSIISGFIFGIATNAYINYSLFFAFAMLYGNFEVRLFFVLPVKVKWMAWLMAAVMGYNILTGGWLVLLQVLLVMLPFVLFFGDDLYAWGKMTWYKLKHQWNNKR